MMMVVMMMASDLAELGADILNWPIPGSVPLRM